MTKNKLHSITFTKKFNKLTSITFTTVRLLDSVYRLGNEYKVFYIYGENKVKIKVSTARLVSMRLTKLKWLDSLFILNDAECDKEQFFEMMRGFYSRRASWDGWGTEVQVLTFKRISYEKLSEIMDKEWRADREVSCNKTVTKETKQ